MSEPLTVTFEIKVGDVWIDPEDVSWRVVSTAGGRVYFKREVATDEDSLMVARKWRKMGWPK